MSGKRIGGCEAARKHTGIDFPCCDSCHEEWACGYGEPSEEYVGKPYESDWFDVCCGLAQERERMEKAKQREERA